MAGRGGRNSTTRKARGGSTSGSTSKHETNQSDGVQLCASCSKDVGDDPIGCDTCEHWVHSTEMCSGLPQKVIDAIAEYDGRGISFSCTKCRIRKESSSSGNLQPLMTELMDQLFQQLRGLCSTVQGLVDQVKALSTKPPQPDPPAPNPDPPAPIPTQSDYKSAIRHEIKEMNEINKRRNSIIIKGLTADSPRDLTHKFSLLTQEVMGTSVTVSDVSSIPNHRNIFRAKILNDDLRKLVLDKSKSLRGSAYNDVYISRDLTYAQRAEMFARRQARRAEANSSAQQPTVPPAAAAQPTQGPETSNQGNSHPPPVSK